MSDNFDKNDFGAELDRRFAESQHGNGEYDIERLANLTAAADETTEPGDGISVDDATLNGFWTLFSLNGATLPSPQASALTGRALSLCHETPTPEETDSYSAAWESFRITALNIAQVLKPVGGEATRYALALEAESGTRENKQTPPRLGARAEAISVKVMVTNRRLMYEELQSQTYHVDALRHIILMLMFGVTACEQLETTLQRIAGLQPK